MTSVLISGADGWPRGEDADDLRAYAAAEGAQGYDVHQVRLCRCAGCGGDVFGIHGDLEEHAAKRICRGCDAEHFIADSGEHWDDSRSGIMVCECDGDRAAESEDFNVAVGYSLYDGGDGIRALAITSRCVVCGRLGYWDDWMIRGGETYLLDLA